MHQDLRRGNVLGHDDHEGLAPLNELRDLVGSLPDLPAVPGELDQLVSLVSKFLRHLELHIYWLWQVDTSFRCVSTVIIHRPFRLKRAESVDGFGIKWLLEIHSCERDIHNAEITREGFGDRFQCPNEHIPGIRRNCLINLLCRGW